tara:strand:- start:8827 stop:9636 length:810 start_codon:yes stop_codon:yes gene_type:complete
MTQNKKVNIVTGYSNPGGSTIAFIRLINLLNENGYDATLYGPHPWHLDKCNAKDLKDFTTDANSILISHYVKISHDMICKKHILACHETGVFDLRRGIKEEMNLDLYDEIVFVSKSQQKWQGNPNGSIVIPNIVDDLEPVKSKMDPPVAGVVGSIDPNKQTHVSIKRAKDDGFEHIDILGDMADSKYFHTEVLPLLNRNIRYVGFCQDRQSMYEGLTAVYHSSQRETFNFVKFECEQTGVKYCPLKSSETGAESWSKEDILKAWDSILG